MRAFPSSPAAMKYTTEQKKKKMPCPMFFRQLQTQKMKPKIKKVSFKTKIKAACVCVVGRGLSVVESRQRFAFGFFFSSLFLLYYSNCKCTQLNWMGLEMGAPLPRLFFCFALYNSLGEWHVPFSQFAVHFFLSMFLFLFGLLLFALLRSITNDGDEWKSLAQLNSKISRETSRIHQKIAPKISIFLFKCWYFRQNPFFVIV